MNTNMSIKWIYLSLGSALILAGCATLVGAPQDQGEESTSQPIKSLQSEPAPSDPDYRIITLLPKDAIPSIDNPRFYDVAEADQEYDPQEMILGVEFEGEARAYSVNMLSSHEIVNDVVAGKPIAVTW
jgi:hypothetical protein